MKYRTIWMSDLHLGTRGCNARGVLEFLRESEFERLYLVGDIVDLWQLRREQGLWPRPAQSNCRWPHGLRARVAWKHQPR